MYNSLTVEGVVVQHSFSMDSRNCESCGRPFKVLKTSSQRHCSANCQFGNVKVGPMGSMIIDKKKRAPVKVTDSGIIYQENSFRDRPTLGKKPEVDKLWLSYVERAKNIVRSMAKDRMDIAKCAIEACDLVHGGGAHWSKFEGVDTLKKFAEDVGISYKTLHNYVRTYRNVVLKVGDIYDETDYASLVRTSNKVNADTPVEEIKKTYIKEKSRKDASITLNTMVRKLRNVNFWFQTTDISKFDKEDLKQMRDICRDIDSRISKCMKI